MTKFSQKKQAVLDMAIEEYKSRFADKYSTFNYALIPLPSEVLRYKESGTNPELAADKYYSKM